jgi:hypothetical protein
MLSCNILQVKEEDMDGLGEREDALPAGKSRCRSMFSFASKSISSPHINITLVKRKMRFDYTGDKKFRKIYDMFEGRKEHS